MNHRKKNGQMGSPKRPRPSRDTNRNLIFTTHDLKGGDPNGHEHPPWN